MGKQPEATMTRLTKNNQDAAQEKPHTIIKATESTQAGEMINADGILLYAWPRPYWFEDGDIVLAVENNTFKIPRSILSTSPIFDGMFDMDLGGIDEKLDGCPLVRIPDSARDWMVVLQWLFLRKESYTSALSFMEPEIPDRNSIRFHKATSALRLSMKYILPELHNIARTILYDMFGSLYHDEPFFWFSCEQAVEAIAVAEECELEQLLPSLYYGLTVQAARFYDAPAPDADWARTMDHTHHARFLSLHSSLTSFYHTWRAAPVGTYVGAETCVRTAHRCWRAPLRDVFSPEPKDDMAAFGLLYALGQVYQRLADAPRDTMCDPCRWIQRDLCLERQMAVLQAVYQCLGLNARVAAEPGPAAVGERPAETLREPLGNVRLPCEHFRKGVSGLCKAKTESMDVAMKSH